MTQMWLLKSRHIYSHYCHMYVILQSIRQFILTQKDLPTLSISIFKSKMINESVGISSEVTAENMSMELHCRACDRRCCNV
jgi:hypothetical protein